jgi:ComF family protein
MRATLPAAVRLVRLAATATVRLVGLALAPPTCAACDAPLSVAVAGLRAAAAFCPGCVTALDRVPERAAPDHHAAFAYGGAMAVAVARFKYERRPDLGQPLGDLLWGAFAARAGPDARGAAERLSPRAAAVVVPVPLHPLRLAERGYNQSALLAARVASGLGAPMAARALRRVRDTPRQATLGRAHRFANVDGAFDVPARRARAVRGRAVILIDDVMTTGSTLRACASALLASGARRVTTLVLAQAE